MSRIGYTVIPVLEFLNGLPFDDLARAYVHGLRPSVVRVSTGLLTSDARGWRVTVMTDEAGRIKRIEQEIDVLLPDGVEHGHALDTELHRRMTEARP